MVLVLVVLLVPATGLCVRFDFLVTRSPGLAKLVLTASISLVDKVDGFIIPVSALASASSPWADGLLRLGVLSPLVKTT